MRYLVTLCIAVAFLLFHMAWQLLESNSIAGLDCAPSTAVQGKTGIKRGPHRRRHAVQVRPKVDQSLPTITGQAELYMDQSKYMQTLANAVVNGLLACVFMVGIATASRMAYRIVYRLGNTYGDAVHHYEAYASEDAKENSVYAQQSKDKDDADCLDQHNHADHNWSTDKVGKTHEIKSDKSEYMWSVARTLMNKAAHIINGNGPRTVSTTWEWDSDDSQHWSDAMLGSPMSPLPLQVRPWWPGRKVTWLPASTVEPPLAQEWPIVIKADMCGEILEIHTVQSMTVADVLRCASDSLMVHEKDLVVLDAGDILPRAMTLHEISWLNIEFALSGNGSNRTGRNRTSRSRTPARASHQVPREIAMIQPDPANTVIAEDKLAYLVVAHTLPKGRKYYPLYFTLDATLSDVRWEFGRVARRGVATFSMWQGAYRFKDKDLVAKIDRTKYLDIWKNAELDGQDDDDVALDDQAEMTDAELAQQLEQAIGGDHQVCQGCQQLRQQVLRLESRIDFLEELLEAPAHLRLRGGGGSRQKKAQDKESTSALPDTYETVLLRAYQLCPSYTKAQLRTLIRSDHALCARLHKTDDPSLIRIIVAAAKRNGMVPGVNAKHQNAEENATSLKTSPSSIDHKVPDKDLSLGELGDDADEDTPVLSLLSTFNVPTVTSLKPGENGVMLGEGSEHVARLLSRFAGSAGSAAVITPARYHAIAVAPVEVVLQFRKQLKDQPSTDYTAMAFLYRLTAQTPELQMEAPVVKIQPKRRSRGKADGGP